MQETMKRRAVAPHHVTVDPPFNALYDGSSFRFSKDPVRTTFPVIQFGESIDLIRMSMDPISLWCELTWRVSGLAHKNTIKRLKE